MLTGDGQRARVGSDELMRTEANVWRKKPLQGVVKEDQKSFKLCSVTLLFIQQSFKKRFTLMTFCPLYLH